MLIHLFLDSTAIVNVADTVMQVTSSVIDHHQELVSVLKMLTPIVAIITPFVFSLIVLIIIFNNKFKKDKLQFEERMKMIEKGLIPPVVVEEKKRSIGFNNHMKPISTWIKLILGFGIGLLLGMILDRLGFNENASYWSMIFVCMGTILVFGDNLFRIQKEQNDRKIEDKKNNIFIENKQQQSTFSKKIK